MKIKVKVTKTHNKNKGDYMSNYKCLLSLALRDIFGEQLGYVGCSFFELKFEDESGQKRTKKYTLPVEADKKAQIAYGRNGEVPKFSPFEFEVEV